MSPIRAMTISALTIATSAVLVPLPVRWSSFPLHVAGNLRMPPQIANVLQEKRWETPLATFAVASVLCLCHPAVAAAEEWSISMNFENGEVSLTDQDRFGPGSGLRGPRFLGSGGGGAVFAFSRSSGTDDGDPAARGGDDVVVKVSWLRSAASVERECAVLRALEGSAVHGVEKCLWKERYPGDARRVVIAMEPVLEDSVASVELIDERLRLRSVRCIVRTMVEMLAADVVTADVQPLISRTTGDVLFVDMTEAKVLSKQRPLPFLDAALATSFCAEMLSLIPESMSEVASNALYQELRAIESRQVQLPYEIYDFLGSQTQFMTQETLDYINTRTAALQHTKEMEHDSLF